MPHSPPSRSGTAPCAGGGLPEGLCRGLGAGTPGVQPDQGAGQGTGSRERDPGRPRTRGKGPSDTALVPPPDHPSTSRHPAGSKPRQSGPEAASGPPIPARLSRRRPITARLFNPAAVPQALPAQPRRGPSERHRPPVPLRCCWDHGRAVPAPLLPEPRLRCRSPRQALLGPGRAGGTAPRSRPVWEFFREAGRGRERRRPFQRGRGRASSARSAAARSRPPLHLVPRVPLRRRSRRLCFGIRRSRACAAAVPAGAVERAGGRSADPSRPGVLPGKGEGGGERAEAEQPLGAGREGTAGFLGTGRAGTGRRGLAGPDAAGRWDWLGWHEGGGAVRAAGYKRRGRGALGAVRRRRWKRRWSCGSWSGIGAAAEPGPGLQRYPGADLGRGSRKLRQRQQKAENLELRQQSWWRHKDGRTVGRTRVGLD
ncbi:translation initiation factor IF-2-like [Pipra filicauda]|uniref:Translation initiation factor IF-2-like n=1 Tax=Pipra filicauda TaxID=649802 RepID=A0A7R5KK31_9PASS|nr:translation initiation factor IF-2-like [Pipra filicauda]